MKYYVFDIDNTLLFTDALNSAGYNFALESLGYRPIETDQRITRQDIRAAYPDMKNDVLAELIEIKQDYCTRHPDLAIPNREIIDILKSQPASGCVFWTNAERERILPLLEHQGLLNEAGYVLFADKSRAWQSIRELCETLGCLPADLTIYEDNEQVREDLYSYHVHVIAADWFRR